MSSPPRIRHLNWNLLRTFLVIAEEKSITKAADRLLVRQPTVTAALQKLEETLGARLIQRDSRRFVLTSRGEALRKECLEISRRVERIGELVAAGEDGLTGTVRILAVTQMTLPALDRALERMHRMHPSVTASISVANSLEIARSVSQRSAPFGFCLLQKPLAALDCRLLMREVFGIYCGRSHPLYGRTDTPLDDLREEPFVGFACGQEGGALEPMVALREGAGLGVRTSGLSADLGEVQRMIAAGIGIGILPVAAAEPAVERGLLWRLPDVGAGLGADLYFLTNPEMQLSPAEAAFQEIFREVAFDGEGLPGERDAVSAVTPRPPAAARLEAAR
jgi:DNA-binding transcriptional LysR family regulator